MSISRAPDHSRSINISSSLLIAQLNELLASLDLPITISSHTELTPSLLICITESLLAVRLPISAQHRTELFTSRAAKVHCTKIFLGVLQSDILQEDVGLSAIDPRRLARGEDAETIYVARLLCWYGRRRGYIARAAPASTRRTGRGSPSTVTTATRRTEPSPVRAFSPDTSVSAAVDGPRCIHEVPSPSLVLSPVTPRADAMLDAEPSERTESHNTTVRYTGFIELVDQAAEIAAFEAQRAWKPPATPDAQILDSAYDAHAVRAQLAAEHARWVALLRRKADILAEMTRLDTGTEIQFRPKPSPSSARGRTYLE
ncbi:hypothetical protein B0H15DRAFT_855450 [Mycena belliarum]|uniref:DUF5745 domain-containing protein n=1 Tax=Mycena belliarum TaxID=1033014 RepID=A0AAD6TXV2_9AGAR|nr:hypothetical protein B0H15DRAFT_855450 [Mycena belliae]